MQKTANYSLNQWEPHDEIKVEDFNADNAAIDAALGGSTRRVLLKEVMLDADTSSFDVDMTGLLQQDYWKIEIYLYGEGSTATDAIVRFNNKSGADDYQYRSFNGTTYNTSCFGSLPLSSTTVKRQGRLILYSDLTYVGGYCEQLGGLPSLYPYQINASSGVTCDNLTTMTVGVNTGVIFAGATLHIYGLKL